MESTLEVTIWDPTNTVGFKVTMGRTPFQGAYGFESTGENRTGKSHFCEALGQHAIETGHVVAWFSIEDHATLIRRHRIDDTITKVFTPILEAGLVIIDDVGLLPITPTPPKASAGSSTPATNNAPLSRHQTCTPPDSTSSSIPTSLRRSSTASCTTLTSWSPKANRSDSPTPPKAEERYHYSPNKPGETVAARR